MSTNLPGFAEELAAVESMQRDAVEKKRSGLKRDAESDTKINTEIKAVK